jgi:small subunit ribosomal protein S8
MSQTHLLSDTLARIKNAQLVKKPYVVVYYSKKVENVLKVFLQEGYIEKMETFEERKGVFSIKVSLKYESRNNHPVISELKIVSKPGKKVFRPYRELGKIYNGLGTLVLSTSKGVITDSEARDLKAGGEILCSIF